MTDKPEIKFSEVDIDPEDTVRISWNSNWGFGEFILHYNDKGQLVLDDEHMSKETVKKAFCFLVDRAIPKRTL